MLSKTPPDVAIRCSGLGKAYHLYGRYNDRLRQVIFGQNRKFYKDFWVLRGVDLIVSRGECLAIVGRNGAGKTTLLQLICGITAPTEGTVAVHGRVAPVLALGAGFDPDLSGRTNARIGATILGLSRAEIDRRTASIAEFSGLGEFFDQPVKYYSSGMTARLAFSVCAHVDADVLIVDEALSVGDAAFRDKCLAFIEAFRQRGTLLFVSHDLNLVRSFCDRAVWIENGEVRANGAPDAVVDAYSAELRREPDEGNRFHIRV